MRCVRATGIYRTQPLGRSNSSSSFSMYSCSYYTTTAPPPPMGMGVRMLGDYSNKLLRN
jgi:hypothetical protein